MSIREVFEKEDFIDEKDIDMVFEGLAMSYQDIGIKIGKEEGKPPLTKQLVAQTAKRAMTKFFEELKKEAPEAPAYKLIRLMAEMLKIDAGEYKEFFDLLPSKVQREVIDSLEK